MPRLTRDIAPIGAPRHAVRPRPTERAIVPDLYEVEPQLVADGTELIRHY